jgi:hypothetical protein
MNESEYQSLLETGWRRPLTADELACLEAWVAGHPEAHADWEAEATLNRVLARLPDAPVASNFAARVLQAVERESQATARHPSFLDHAKRWFRRPAPRLAWALLLVGVLWLGYDRYQANVQTEVAKGMSVLANVASLSDPAVLQDFEAIQRLSQAAPGVDDELYAVLNQ